MLSENSEMLDTLTCVGINPGGTANPLVVTLGERIAFFEKVSFSEDFFKDLPDEYWIMVQDLLVHVIRCLRRCYYIYNRNRVPDYEFDEMFRGLQWMESQRPQLKVSPSPTDEIE